MFFGRDAFDPQLIISQMLVMQCCFYLSLGAFLVALDHLFGVPVNMDQFFTAYSFRTSSSFGWSTLVAFLINSLAGAVTLMVVVERAKKCLDFAATVQFFHLISVCAYDGFPSHWEWWVVTILSLTITVVIGEVLCMRKELVEIPVGRR
mmetsp:Transcript_10269/g.23409  ORF Transcript_10269/g.23409 Transcript_10269/m.23409 type:complete len:149 (+) Transcript_10269:93-539(+)